MWTIIIILAAAVASLALYAHIISGKRKKSADMDDKPVFRTEEDLEEYGKPMKDRPSTIDPHDGEE